ncbi:MAG: PKD domain-containing protein, partial [Bacteroidales bacterium]|nr:PKD domain-containing protein [Bacteroidales bacterium]
MKCSIKLLVFIFLPILVIGQDTTGLPIWTQVADCDDGWQYVDWRTNPPTNHIVPNSAPSFPGASNAGIDLCGNLIFLVVHSGLANTPNNLFLYSPNGVPILNDTTPNGPGLNSDKGDSETVVVNIPNTPNQWYIIYKKWKTDNGAPGGSGSYTPAEILYTRVEYTPQNIIIHERDEELKANGTAYTYMMGKEATKITGSDNYYLYACRRSANNDSLSLDRFLITENGIDFDANTGEVYAPWWYLTISGSYLEVSKDGNRVGITTRNESSNTIDAIIFDANNFNNNPSSYQSIIGSELILEPDPNYFTTPMPVSQASTINGLGFLSNFDKKLAPLDFSPDGRYLYLGQGGHAATGMTNASYIAQIDIGEYSNPATYPYNVRMQVQIPPGTFNSSTGQGGPLSAHDGEYYLISAVSNGFDDNFHFLKRDTNIYYVIPQPNQPLPHSLTPGYVDLSTPSQPNIDVSEGTRHKIPNQIDNYNYIAFQTIEADLGGNQSFCNNDSIILDPGNQFTYYNWNDNSSDSIFTVTNGGQYYVEVMDIHGCASSDTVNITEIPLPEANAGSDESVCEGNTYDFSNSSILPSAQDYDSLSWYGGTGVFNDPTLLLPAYTPGTTETGAVTLTLVAYSEFCDNDTSSMTLTILNSPEAGYSYLPEDTVCSNTTLFFQDTSAPNIVNWFWDFGDGNSSTNQNPSHVFTNAGNFDVKLIVTSSNGCSDSAIHNFVIHESPVSSILVSPSTEVCANTSLLLTGNSTTNIVSWYWDFDDGTNGSGQNINHNYPLSGQYLVSLMVTNNAGCHDTSTSMISVFPNPTGDFTINPNDTSCVGEIMNFDATGSVDIIQWNWDFDDGSSATGQNVNHSFDDAGTYYVELVVSNDDGCSDTIIHSVEILDPEIDFTMNQHPSCLNDTVFFNGISDVGVGFTEWIWNFGDGVVDTGQNVWHIYSIFDTFNVSLSVCTKEVSHELIVYQPADADAGSNESICEAQAFDFSNSSTQPSAISYESLLWQGGTGSFDDPTTLLPVYTPGPGEEGPVPLYLIAYSNAPCQHDTSFMILTLDSLPEPSFSYLPATNICVNEALQFNGQNDNTTTISTWEWDFGDGGTASVQNPLYSYSSAGTYNVKLTLTNAEGCVDSI